MMIDPLVPGSELISKGLADLSQNLRTEESLLIPIAEPSLRFAGLTFPALLQLEKDDELILYDLLCKSRPGNPHSAYNALIRRVTSFCKSYRFAKKNQ